MTACRSGRRCSSSEAGVIAPEAPGEGAGPLGCWRAGQLRGLTHPVRRPPNPERLNRSDNPRALRLNAPPVWLRR